jgi:hypothetical protein
MAQQPAPQSASAPKLGASSVAAMAPTASPEGSPIAYRSVFDGFKGLTEQPVQPWRESNGTVGHIGGWQSYARERQGGPVAGSAPPSEAKGMPGMPGRAADHGGMNMAPSGGGAAPPMAPEASTPGPGKTPGKTPPDKPSRPQVLPRPRCRPITQDT